MPKPKLIVYSQELSNCPCFRTAFNTEFHAEVADTSEKLLSKIRAFSPDVVVICFCSAREEDAEELLRIDALSGPLPVISCSKTLTFDFIREAAQQGVKRFLCCKWEEAKIATTILDAIQRGGIKEFLEVCYPRSLGFSPHVHKIVNAVVHAFPHRLHENEVANRLGISKRWLLSLCRQAFSNTFTQLMRRIWVYQALRMMRHTNLDNTEIALQLNYSEEGSMARDFHKELGYSPTEARKRLANRSPEELLK